MINFHIWAKGSVACKYNKIFYVNQLTGKAGVDYVLWSIFWMQTVVTSPFYADIDGRLSILLVNSATKVVDIYYSYPWNLSNIIFAMIKRAFCKFLIKLMRKTRLSFCCIWDVLGQFILNCMFSVAPHCYKAS